jgi:hypothetical protein
MTRQEVEAVVGVAPGDYAGRRVKIIHDEVRDGVRVGGQVGPSDHYQEWVGEEIAILVWLDDEGRVSRKECVPTSHVMPRAPSLLDRLRRWLRW